MVLANSLLTANPGLIVWLLIVFSALLYLLSRYAWGPITQALAEREQNIDASIRRAEAALEESKRLQQDNAQARRAAELEAQRLLREAAEEAEALRATEVQRTREDLAAMRARAKKENARERDQALQTLRSEVADLAILGAEKILQENLDAGRQRALVDRFIDGLGKQTYRA